LLHNSLVANLNCPCHFVTARGVQEKVLETAAMDNRCRIASEEQIWSLYLARLVHVSFEKNAN